MPEPGGAVREQRRPRTPRAFDLLALAALFAGLAAWSWQKWTDPIIDFGLELYLPWRIVEGEVLYRDLAYRNGPLSPYWNAAWFAIAGVSLRTLVFVNLAILAAIVALLHALMRRAFDRGAAFLACAAFLSIFAFSQYGSVGNYNFVTPYQHGQTHGLLLGLAAVALLARGVLRDETAAWAAAGACSGLVALTKAEVFVPALACAGPALVLHAARSPRWIRHAGAFGALACAPALIALAALAGEMPFALALRGVLGNAPYLGAALLHDPFYLHQAGLDDPSGSALRLLASTAVACGFAALLRFGIPPLARRAAGPALPVGLGILVFGALALAGERVPWNGLARALPVVAIAACAVFGLRCWRTRGGAAREISAPLHALLLACYALLLLGKLGLDAQLQHYGFALAAPAFALWIGVSMETISGSPVSTGPLPLSTLQAARCTRAIVAGVVAACAVTLVTDSQRIYAEKTLVLGEGGDRIRVARPEVSPRGEALARTLRGLDALAPEGATLLVLPEGVSLNYWLRLRNPTPYSLYLPTELAAHGGEAAMLPRIAADPPDFVVLVHRASREFGVGPFLTDARNGRALGEWLAKGYRRVSRIGSEPFQSDEFGVVVLRRAGS